jgi:hypothetical protein
LIAITAGTAKHGAKRSGSGRISDYYHKKKMKDKRRRKTIPGTAKHRAKRSGSGRMRKAILPLELFQV